MKLCPKCNQQYDDDNLNFCLSDGELLMETKDADATPTVYMDAPRVTNQNLDSSPPPSMQQDFGNQQMSPPVFATPQNFPAIQTKDKTLATVALILGILSFLMSCCYLGLFFGPGALITGYIAMNRANSDPENFGGKDIAIIGMVIGGISFVLSIILIFFGILGAILDS